MTTATSRAFAHLLPALMAAGQNCVSSSEGWPQLYCFLINLHILMSCEDLVYIVLEYVLNIVLYGWSFKSSDKYDRWTGLDVYAILAVYTQICLRVWTIYDVLLWWI